MNAPGEERLQQWLGPNIEEILRGNLWAAIRRKIIGPDGEHSRPTTTMADHTPEELRDSLSSVMLKGTNYERDEVIQAAARHLGFARVIDSIRGGRQERCQQRHPPRHPGLRRKPSLETIAAT